VAAPLIVASGAIALLNWGSRLGRTASVLALASAVSLLLAQTRLFGLLSFLPRSHFALSDPVTMRLNIGWAQRSLGTIFNIIPAANLNTTPPRLLGAAAAFVVFGGAMAAAARGLMRASVGGPAGRGRRRALDRGHQRPLCARQFPSGHRRRTILPARLPSGLFARNAACRRQLAALAGGAQSWPHRVRRALRPLGRGQRARSVDGQAQAGRVRERPQPGCGPRVPWSPLRLRTLLGDQQPSDGCSDRRTSDGPPGQLHVRPRRAPPRGDLEPLVPGRCGAQGRSAPFLGNRDNCNANLDQAST